MLKEGIPYLLVIWAAADIEEIDCNTFVIDINFLHTIIDSNCRYVLVYKFPLAVAFNNAGLPCFGIAY